MAWPDGAAFSVILSDPRFYAAAAVAILSGAVRGFAGFGSALIYVPLVAAIYDPRTAAVTLLLVDLIGSAPLSTQAVMRCNWREVLPVSLASCATIPLGVFILLYVDPTVLRWSISVLVLALLAVLASGWRYRGSPSMPTSLAVGAVAGVGGGAVQIAGPPVIIYWLSGQSPAAVVRANLMTYFLATDIVGAIAYGSRGLFTTDILALVVLLGVPFLLAMALGALLFRGASELSYRRVAYGLIAAAALLSIPLFDRVLR